jgi:hypothetical protein
MPRRGVPAETLLLLLLNLGMHLKILHFLCLPEVLDVSESNIQTKEKKPATLYFSLPKSLHLSCYQRRVFCIFIAVYYVLVLSFFLDFI